MFSASAGSAGVVYRMFILISFAALFSATAAGTAGAQNWSTDARSIALGSGGTENHAAKMAQEERQYRAIVIPLGLFQVLPDWSVFNPGGDEFDPVRAIEYAASPLHYNFGRESSSGSPQGAFIRDIVNAELNRDLNAYRGFTPATSIVAEGLASPSWGKTISVRRDADGYFQGVYVGAGPYFSVRTAASFDERLATLLGSPTDVYLPNTTFLVRDTTTEQLALAITGGYRARLALANSVGARDGVYVAANYNYLHGFRYDDFDMDVRFDTDTAGLVTFAPATEPIAIGRLASSSGRGFAIDLGVAIVANRWEVGFGANGIANRITWNDVEREAFVLQSLLNGGEFVETTFPGFVEARRVELPVDYSANVGYSSDAWSVVSQYSHGFQGDNFRAGGEYRFGPVDLRGGARFSQDLWHPTVGAGFNFTPGFALDVALYATSTNLERRRDPAMALSLRFNR
jgi:hypothetical protein